MNKQKTKERKMQKTRSQKGITLIALIITIIVLLILAVVAIQAVTGDGIIFHAENATTEYGIASEKESIQLAVMSAKKYIPNVSIDTAELESQLGKVDGITITKGTDKWTVTSEKTGLVYEINLSTGNTLSEEATAIVADTAPGTLETLETNKYEINSIEDLVALAYNVNSGTNTYSGATVTLGRNLYFDGSFNSYANPDAKYVLDENGYGYIASETSETTIKSLLTSTNGIGFVPIGLNSGTGTFAGDFDGNGNFIDGMYVNATNCGGLFGWVTTAITISNLGMTNGNINGNYSAGAISGCNAEPPITITNCYNTGKVSSTAGYAAGICASSSASIEDCYNTGVITSQTSYAGGISCRMSGSNKTIMGCYNTGKIISNSTNNSYVGGISCLITGGSLTIKECYNIGEIVSNPTSTNGSYAGGILAAGNPTIMNCYNTGSVSSTSAYVGGIVGNGASIENCYNTGNVSSIKNSVGGIEGYRSNSSTILGCYNTGTVTSDVAQAGGILGCASSGTTITNCYNTGIISSSGSHSGGMLGGAATTSTITILNCYNTGNITSSSNIAGGLCGQASATITNCFNSGSVSGGTPSGGIVGGSNGSMSITNCFNNGSVTVTAPAGGIYSGPAGTITTCYSTGTVTSTINLAGTLYGYGSPTVTDCGERTIDDFLTIFNNYVTTNNNDSTKTQLRQWQLADGKLIFSL